MIYCKELKKDFATKAEMFKALKDNKTLIMDKKKSVPKFTDWLDMRVMAVKSEGEEKAAGEEVIIELGDYIFPVINTTKILDSHGDVHLDDIWNVSVKDQQGKIYYIINHELELGKVIAYQEDVELMVKTLPWTELGENYEGNTQALIFKVKLTDKGNEAANKAIMGKVALQNSVRMKYVRLKLCINDPAEYYKEEFSNWRQYIDVVVNRKDAEDQGYFWAVMEAQIYLEGSAVLRGSNPVTPILSSIDEKTLNPPAGSLDNKDANPPVGSSAARKSILHNLV